MTKLAKILIEKAVSIRSKGMISESRSILEDLVAMYPDDAEALSLLGQVCVQQSDFAAAIRYLDASCHADPTLLDALFTLGVACQMTGSNQRAIEIFDRVIEAAPNLPHTHRYRGMALQELGNGPEAKKAFERALALAPEYAEAMGSLANLLLKHCHFDVAKKLMLQALELKPGLNDVRNNLARLYQLEGKGEEVVDRFREVLKLEPDNRLALSNLLYSLCYLDSISYEEMAAEHVSLCESFYSTPSGLMQTQESQSYPKDSRLRIGYISNDFCLHSVSYFMEPVLINHDRSEFLIFCYSNRSALDETTFRIRSLNLEWRDISALSAEDAAKLIRNDAIDILVDLSGHSAKNRLDVCALKPAPVLATWIGYPHSTGMRQFDYYISDQICDPHGMTENFYCEQIYRLPRVFSCYLPPEEFPPVSAAPYRKNGYITFGSFNNLAKVGDKTISLWSSVLKSVPGSRLFIKSASLGGVSARKHLVERFAKYGIHEERLILRVHTPSQFEHLKLYDEVDIALDTYPYNGTTTTCEALWMGTPVVTFAGGAHLSRVGASFLVNVGCPELVAHTLDEFMEIASGLASDLKQIDDYRNGLRTAIASSPLMDGAGVTRDVEVAYKVMYERYLNGKAKAQE